MVSNNIPSSLTEPIWRPRSRLSRAYLPQKYRPWLLDSGSLTQRIVRACRGSFRVHVIDQRWARPMRNEVRILKLRFNHYALVREVFLRCDDTAWVYARTIIPSNTLTGATRRLACLRSRSLGAFLFADPTLHRGEVEIAHLTPNDKLFGLATRSLSAPLLELWGRRARFSVMGKALLVSEIFLPTIGAFPKDDHESS